MWGCLPGGTSLCNNPAWEALLGVAVGCWWPVGAVGAGCWRSFLPCRTLAEAGSKHSCISLIAFTHQASCPSSWQSNDIVDGPEPLSQSRPKGCIQSRGPARDHLLSEKHLSPNTDETCKVGLTEGERIE